VAKKTISMKKLYILLVLLSVNNVHAQEIQLIKEVVISGAKKETNKIEISQTIDIITKKDLKFNSASNMGDALQNTGMITVQQSQNGGGSPMMRGFEANRIGIVVDGVRMNTAIFRGGHLQNALRVDNGNLERIEVFYGAGSTLYGSDALGGVLNFMTVKPTLNIGFTGSSFARYTSAMSEKTAGFTLNYGKDKWASLTSFTYSDFGNVMMGNSRDPQYGNWGKRFYYTERVNNIDVMTKNENPNEQVNSAYKQYNILQKFLFQPNENTNHLFNFQYSNSSDVSRYDRLTEKVNNAKDAEPNINKFTSSEWYYGPEARLMAAYTLNKKGNFIFSDNYRLTAAYQNYKESRNTRNFGNNNFRSQRENVDVASINFDLFKTIQKHQFTYGLEINNNWVASSVKRLNIMTGAESYASTRYPDGGALTGSYAAYIQDIVKLSKDKLYLNLGGRISQNTISATVNDTNRKYGSFDISNLGYSLNAGVSYIPTKFNKICFNFSTGYRTPNLDDVTKVFDNTSWIQVNDPNVKPELAMNFEINSWNKLSEKTLIEFGGYYTAVSDYIINQATTVNGLSSELINGKSYTYQRLGNAATAMILGTYASYKFNIDEHWEFNGNFNYTFGRVRMADGQDQKPLDHIAPLSGRLALKFKKNKFQSELSMMLNGTKKTEEYSTSGEDNIDKSADPINGFTPAWEVYNFRTSYDISKNFSVQAALENIFDTHYRIFASGISSSGRSLRFTFRFNF
jgi:hemoglobin/transferrin/lactoferrin receptor protein